MSTAIQARLSTLIDAFRNKQLDLGSLRARLLELSNLAQRQGGGDVVDRLGDLNQRLEMIATDICASERRGAVLEVLDDVDDE
mgnify:CR=1 FL=1